jgi:hypothetical protein
MWSHRSGSRRPGAGMGIPESIRTIRGVGNSLLRVWGQPITMFTKMKLPETWRVLITSLQ